MEVQKSRNGFYTITFINKKNLDNGEILRLFSTVGKVWKVIHNGTRIFIRFREKEAAEKAIEKFGANFKVEMAKNNDKLNNGQIGESNSVKNQLSSQKDSAVLPSPIPSTPKMDNLKTGYHLILGNLPKSYTVKDVRGLIEEAKPISVTTLGETKAFNLKFCHIVLDSSEGLSYLIDKLNGFVICGEKLIAVEAKNLLEWRGLKQQVLVNKIN